jgi:hypothetical protein
LSRDKFCGHRTEEIIRNGIGRKSTKGIRKKTRSNGREHKTKAIVNEYAENK